MDNGYNEIKDCPIPGQGHWMGDNGCGAIDGLRWSWRGWPQAGDFHRVGEGVARGVRARAIRPIKIKDRAAHQYKAGL